LFLLAPLLLPFLSKLSLKTANLLAQELSWYLYRLNQSRHNAWNKVDLSGFFIVFVSLFYKKF